MNRKEQLLKSLDSSGKLYKEVAERRKKLYEEYKEHDDEYHRCLEKILQDREKIFTEINDIQEES